METTRILPIHIGGTIASAKSSTGFKPKHSFSDLLSHTAQNLPEALDIAQPITPFGKFGIDSASMRLHQVIEIAKTIADNYRKYDAFILTHGTDTLAYTASMLSFMLYNIQKPVILTGAQKTLEDDDNDVADNLKTSLLAAATRNSGVWVAFHGKISRGVRTTKADIAVNSSDAFISNARDEIDISLFQSGSFAVNRGKTEEFHLTLEEQVDIFCLTHTTRADMLKNYLETANLRAVISLIYGMSGHRSDLIDVLTTWADRNGAVIIAKSHSPYGSTDLSKYELGVNALKKGVLSCLDMTLESAYAKTCYLCSKEINGRQLKDRFYENMCGELNEEAAHAFIKRADHWTEPVNSE